MFYLLGGAARSGKTTIAQKFLAERGIPFFSLDYLMMGFANGAPQFGVDPEENDLQTAKRLSPVIKAMATAMLENGEEYLLEGVQLHPKVAADLCAQFDGQVCACFLGYAEIDVKTKFQQIRHYNGGNNDWPRHQDDAQLLEMVERLKAMSNVVRSECQAYGLRYFEISTDFTTTLDEVVTFLKNEGNYSGIPR